jgi:hypothetical protein
MITALPSAQLVSQTGAVFATATGLTMAQDASTVTIAPISGASVAIPAATDSLAGALDAARATIIDNLAPVASSGKYTDLTAQPDNHHILHYIFDGGGSALVAPITRYFYAPFAAVITGWVALADASGSCTIDIWKKPLVSYPPVVGNSITGGNPLQLSSQISNSAFSLTNWTTQINAGDVLAFNLSSSSTVKVVTAQLIITH